MIINKDGKTLIYIGTIQAIDIVYEWIIHEYPEFEYNTCILTSEVEDKLLAVDRDLWKKEVEQMKEFYKQFGDKLPDGLKQELADLEARLG